MDFGTLLSVAQRNESNKQTKICYQTKYSPPKKQTKQAKNLSENIKKFLARKEEEERQKALEEKKKKENLLALRDHKAQSRISKHLKVCKAANKSVLADAVDNDNTAVTMAGPSQPDEDDYGYVSQEASAFYNKLISKYNSLPPEKPLFSEIGKKTVKDIARTKDRVKQALKQQEMEDALGHRRKRKSSVVNGEHNNEKEFKDDIKDKVKEKEEKFEDDKPKTKKKPSLRPPPMDFSELLKLAEKKQHEPIIIETKPKVEEPERLMTKKQMKEYIKEKEWRERKEQRSRNPEITTKPASTCDSNKLSKTVAAKTSKLMDKSPVNALSNKVPKKVSEKPGTRNETMDKISLTKTLGRDELLEERKKIEAEKKKLEEMRRVIEEEKRKLALDKNKKIEDKKSSPGSQSLNKLSKSKELQKVSPTKDIKLKNSPAHDVRVKQFPPPDVKSRPPAMATERSKTLVSKRPPQNKRRILDDDEEYDSELDDFIDDGPEEHPEDVSKYISEIFGYDKNKYRNLDDDDDAAMESNFAQQLKEEFVSTKIGIMEDLEDIRKEALEKKKKALMKKKIKK
ncbi:protein SPT2 homolog [Prorops nasuta]|uniref:protein SPT2 homolog n=1 Tax=Prorops nasuta TaxID=863751 RepID=UPI0034CFF129